MVKIIAAGIWVCIVTLGAVYFSVHMATATTEVSEEDLRKAKLELVRGESLTIPMIADGAVKGYFLGKISFMMEKEKIQGMELPMTELMTDELFTLLVGNKMIDIADISSFDVAAFRTTIKEDLNKHLGDAIIDEVLIEQLDYLSKTDIRNAGDAQQAKNEPVKIVEGVKVEETKSGGH